MTSPGEQKKGVVGEGEEVDGSGSCGKIVVVMIRDVCILFLFCFFLFFSTGDDLHEKEIIELIDDVYKRKYNLQNSSPEGTESKFQQKLHHSMVTDKVIEDSCEEESTSRNEGFQNEERRIDA